MKFDDILKSIGEFGPYQIKIYFMVCLIGIPVAMNQMGQVFYAANTDHWCAVAEWESNYDACSDLDGDEYMGCIHQYRNASIPPDEEDEDRLYAQCSKYDANYTTWADGYYAGDETTRQTDCDEGWIYDKSEYTRTIKTDFDLVCDKKSAADFSQSAFFFGVLLGSLLYGFLADFLGRVKSFYIAVVTLFVFTLSVTFMPSLWSYTVMRCLVAMSNMGCFLLAFIIGTEFVGPSKRVIAGILIEVFFSFGYMLLAILAYFIRDWRVLNLVVAGLLCLFPFTIFFVPESPRWLISNNKCDKAEKIIYQAAKGNKKEDKLPEDFMSDLKKRKKWFINSLVYYGLSLSTSDLGSNDFIAFFISGAVELPAYLLCIFAIESPLGRKYSTSGFELLGGVACLLTIFIPKGPWKTTVAMIGKFGISASFALIYIYSAEVLPTPVRSTGMGLCSMAARVAGILAPLILLLDEYWEPLPLLIFGSTCIVGGLLLLFLPETRGRQLPETMEEGEHFKMRSKESNYDVEKEEGKVVSSISGETNAGYDDEDRKI
ncbi:putative organic cation transporter protein-like [Apostichopus japonicus]|uniref:Putative organic cation transporter protein-like n=1 Tax=Stichopus japonicus TaxID=307972 RepID=A0A2G8KS66_STIJA|nr:putative organic cation transporter protein-like [Apostichopus japonicus]